MDRPISIVQLLLCHLLSLSFALTALQAQNSIGIIGDASDISTNPESGILLMGGASDNDDAMVWMLEKADGGDIVVLRATGTDAYNDCRWRSRRLYCQNQKSRQWSASYYRCPTYASKRLAHLS